VADGGLIERSESTLRAVVFKHRGALLAVPAAFLVALGRPSAFSVALGLPLALAGELLRCWSVGYSGITTRADSVTAPILVTAGPYAYVRNPLYLANFITAAGFAIAFTGGVSAVRRAMLIACGLGTVACIYATVIPHEEAYLRRTFGSAFERYVARVPRIIPRRDPALPGEGTYEPTVIRRAESRTFVTFGAMLLALAVKARRGGGR
jgi:protein-S-isoprenylcysteine O-methyltransferase Ste14